MRGGHASTRVCIDCGAEFEGKGGSVRCLSCQSRRESEAAQTRYTHADLQARHAALVANPDQYSKALDRARVNYYQRKNHPITTATCVCCGTQFATSDRRRRYCSAECRTLGKRQTELAVWERLKSVSPQKATEQQHAAYIARRKATKPVFNPSVGRNVICAECGKHFFARGRCKYCSDACRQSALTRYNREYKRRQRAQIKSQ